MSMEVKMDLNFGLIPSVQDKRDYVYGAIRPTPVGLPATGPRVHKEIPIRNQGAYPTCVGFASQRIKDEQEYKERSYIVGVSPSFVYTYCKQLDGNPYAGGTYPRVAMQVLTTVGACTEKTMPYSTMTPVGSLPNIPTGANEEAAMFKTKAYARISSIEEIKTALLYDGPVMLAVMVCDNFLTAPGGMVSLPAGVLRGLHAITAVSWDDNMKTPCGIGAIVIANSWGTSWGDGGYGYIPYEFFSWKSDLGQPACCEAWSCVDMIVPPNTAKVIDIWVGRDTAKVDGVEVLLDVPPIIKEGRTLVPLRFLTEHFGYKVTWYPDARRVHLEK